MLHTAILTPQDTKEWILNEAVSHIYSSVDGTTVWYPPRKHFSRYEMYCGWGPFFSLICDDPRGMNICLINYCKCTEAGEGRQTGT